MTIRFAAAHRRVRSVTCAWRCRSVALDFANDNQLEPLPGHDSAAALLGVSGRSLSLIDRNLRMIVTPRAYKALLDRCVDYICPFE